MLEEGKASKTINPDGTTGVYFKIETKEYEAFRNKCDNDCVKYTKKIAQLIKNFNKKK